MVSSILAGLRRWSIRLSREKPRNYIDVLKNYKRLLRLELEKRQATIETASEVDPATTFRDRGQSEEANTAAT